MVVLKLGELFTQLARYQTYWNKNNQAVLADKSAYKRKYFVLGDSAAQGIGATSPRKSYPALVAQEVEAKTGEKIGLINLSKSGALIRDAIDQQLPVLKSQKITPQTIITVEIGANDILSFDKVKFEKDMDEFMAGLPKQTIVSDIPSFRGTRFGTREKNVLEANEIIVRLSDKHGLKRAQLYDKVAINTGLSTLAVDLFHPSNKGYRQNWAPAFLEQIAP